MGGQTVLPTVTSPLACKRLAALATQLAKVLADNSIRSPLASS